MSLVQDICMKRYNGWFATGAAAFIFAGVNSAMVVYALLFVAIEDDLQCTAVQTGMIASVCWAVSYMASPLCEYLSRFISYRSIVILGATLTFLSILVSSFLNGFIGLLIFYGIGYGFGCNFVSHGIYCTMFQHFPEKNFTLATGIALCGCTMGTFLQTVTYEYLLPVRGWRSCLRFSSLFAGVVSIPASLLFFGPHREDTTAVGNNQDASNQGTSSETADIQTSDKYSELTEEIAQNTNVIISVTWKEVLTHPVSWIIVLSVFFPTLAWCVYYINIVSYFNSVHIEGRCLSNLLTIIPVFELIGRTAIGILEHAIPRTYLLLCHHLLFLIVSAFVAFIPVYESLFICTMLIGAGRASYQILPFPVTSQLLPTKDSNKAVTIGMVAIGLGFTMGSIPAGAIYDTTGSYTYAFVLNMAFYLLGAILLICAINWKHFSVIFAGNTRDQRQRVEIL